MQLMCLNFNAQMCLDFNAHFQGFLQQNLPSSLREFFTPNEPTSTRVAHPHAKVVLL